jgi:hypothetical protein
MQPASANEGTLSHLVRAIAFTVAIVIGLSFVYPIVISLIGRS